MGRSVGVRFWPELPLMIRAANGGCEPNLPHAATCTNGCFVELMALLVLSF